MSLSKQIAGKIGEDAAVSYLLKKGYHIVERNFRIRNGEIDIIAIDKSTKPQTLVFVEVKTREGDTFGTPFESITPNKVFFLKRAASYFVMTHRNLPELQRIDAVAVNLEDSGLYHSIEHIQNISQ